MVKVRHVPGAIMATQAVGAIVLYMGGHEVGVMRVVAIHTGGGRQAEISSAGIGVARRARNRRSGVIREVMDELKVSLCMAEVCLPIERNG